VILDRIAGGLLLLVAAGAIWHAQSLVVPFAADPIGPKAFPTVVGVVLALAGASILFAPGRVEWQARDWGRVLAVAGSSLAYPLVVEPLGFVAATAALCFLVALAFRGGVLKSAIAAVALAVAFLILIDLVLGLPLPRGPLGI